MKENKDFKSIIVQTELLKNCYQGGLQALGKNSSKIALEDTKKCSVSVDIDTCLKQKYPGDSRWDYVVSYQKKAYFVEIHPAFTTEVELLLKQIGLKIFWIKKEVADLKKIAHETLYWIPTDKYAIRGGRYERLLAQNKIIITKILNLPQG